MPNLHRGFVAALAVLALMVPAAAQQQARPSGWTEATHGRDAAPDYARLFALDRVHEIRITIPPAQFAAMQEDLQTISAVPFGPNGPEPGRGFDPNFGPGRGGPIRLTTRDPMYAPVTVEHGGRAWTKVGMRFKGNSSLTASVGMRNGKLPFRLNFDRYEDESPEIQNQRFYGFQEMTFSSNFGDDSQLREVLANEVFRDRGLPAPRVAFYRVYVNTGSGPQYWGLYTMVEDPADGSMLQSQFGSRTGNLYKPDGPGADWTTFNTAGFEKKNNEDENNFSDVRGAITALHAAAPSPEAWRTSLERVFDVDQFLRWLAVNTAISNWDAYGALAHNYYLYADPARNGRLRWIPWDNNFAFAAGPGGGGPGRGGFGPPGGRGFGPPGAFGPPGGRGGFGPPPGGRGRGGVVATDVLHRQVGAEWPLIQRLLADPVYQARYRTELERAMSGLMAPQAFERRARELHKLITPSLVGSAGEQPTHSTISSAEAFQAALDGADGLIAFVTGRERTVRDALRAPATP